MNKKELQTAIENEIKGADAKVTLLVESLNTGEILLSYHAGIPVVSASIIKVPIMLTALELVQKSELKADTPIKLHKSVILEDTEVFEYGEGRYTLDELLVWMVINSDNTATNCLIDLLTGKRINEFCHRMALKNTKLERRMLDFEAIKCGRNNYTSAQDMLSVYKALYNRTILTPRLCDYAVSILLRQRQKQISMRYISDDVKVAHKTGELDYLNHDAGIFYLKEADYYFGAFVSEAPNNDYAMRWIGRVSKLIYEYYKQLLH